MSQRTRWTAESILQVLGGPDLDTHQPNLYHEVIWSSLYARRWTPMGSTRIAARLVLAMWFALLACSAGTGCARTFFQVCGNGLIEGTEVCDDANASSGDGCSAVCATESGFECTGVPSVCTMISLTCGDGMVDPGEACDDMGESVFCDSNCTDAECGDGTVNATAGEQCDDGNTVDGDGCSASCVNQPIGCGNGMVEAGEDCDDGVESASCDADCTFAACGDATLNIAAGEQCDDAGASPTCDADCSLAMCGDGTFNANAGEACDDGGPSPLCDGDCTLAMCGDGTLNVAAGEDCDDGGESAACDADCSVAICGDGTLNTSAAEQCDDGGESAACDVDCTAAMCGDGTINTSAAEQCDDGGESVACDADCTAAVCGDGTLNTTAAEQCDDGGESATCDVDCTPAMCGDGTTNTTAGEQCDDGNTVGGDGCSSTCTSESSAGIYIAELNIGDDDYIVLTNGSATSIDLSGMEVLFDDSSLTDRTTVLPAQLLAAGASVYVAETPQAGDIDSGGNITFSYQRGGAVLLCMGSCTSGANVLDAVGFDVGEPVPALPSPVTFGPSPLTGIGTAALSNSTSWLRISTSGVNPAFLSSDWTTGPAIR